MAVSKILTNAIASNVIPASLIGAPGNPASTTSTSAVMMGLGSAFKLSPTKTGRFLILVEADGVSTVATASFTAGLRYGTGTAPANGVAATGTQPNNWTSGWSAVANAIVPFSIGAVLTGLTIGTQYWFDLAFYVSAGTGSVENINYQIIEF